MNKAKNDPIKLVNKYTKEKVYTRDYNEVIKEGNNEFIRVFNESNPNRTFLVNRTAFVIDK
jgi:hypothetical protein